MGLDMYLYKKTYVKNWEHMGEDNFIDISIKPRVADTTSERVQLALDIDPKKITFVVEEIAYWRKFNALHSWIVHNCADGIDECQTINMNYRHFEQLENTLEKILKLENEEEDAISVAKELFPTGSGFFFGSMEYDEYYWSELKETLEIVKQCLNDYKKHAYNCSYYYKASW